LHTIDDGQFRVALFRFLEQALSLIEETRVFKCDTHAVGKRLQQAHVRVAEGTFILHVNDFDQPTRLIACDQRHH